MWAGAQRPKDEGRGYKDTRPIAQYEMSMCIDHQCWLTNTESQYLQRLKAVKQRFANLTMSPLKFQAGKMAARCLGSGPVSLGFASVLMALSSCEGVVHLYGFMPHCCDPKPSHHGWPSLNYKYFHSNASQWVCCSSGREKMDREFARYHDLEKRGLVRMHPPLGRGPLPIPNRSHAAAAAPRPRAPVRTSRVSRPTLRAQLSSRITNYRQPMASHAQLARTAHRAVAPVFTGRMLLEEDWI